MAPFLRFMPGFGWAWPLQQPTGAVFVRMFTAMAMHVAAMFHGFPICQEADALMQLKLAQLCTRKVTKPCHWQAPRRCFSTCCLSSTLSSMLLFKELYDQILAGHWLTQLCWPFCLF